MTRTYRFKVKKLIRDNMPDILRKSGIKAFTRVLGDDEYLQQLKEKLLEEANEAIKANTLEDFREELADVLEVVLTLGQVHGISAEDIEAKRLEKKAERGGFEAKIYSSFEELDATNPYLQYYLSKPDSYPEMEE